jgi:hypothetical protein
MKVYMSEKEVSYLKTRHPGLYDAIKDKIYPLEAIVRRADVMTNLNESLGAIASEYGYGVAQSSDVSGLRDFGPRPVALYSDTAHDLSEIYATGEPGVVTQKWLEHRRVCTRDLLACLSGETHGTR